MERLSPKDFHTVRMLFREKDYQLIIIAVLNQSSPGEIYVDDVQCPTTAFMMSPEGNFLVGNHQNAAFNAHLKHLLVDKMGEAGHIEIQYAPDVWANSVTTLFQIEAPLIFTASYFTLNDLTLSWQTTLPSKWTLCTVDQAFLNRNDIENIEIIKNKIAENWVSRETFFEQGFGLCLLHDKRVVSECLADCVSGTRCEIGISTDPHYQRQGLATLTVAATVAHCQARGLTSIGWHCADSNLGSIKTAEKVGFVKQRTYPIYELIPDQFRNLCANGAYRVFQERWDDAVAAFEMAFSLQDPPARYFYLAAVAHAMIGNYKCARRYLERALTSGVVTCSQIKTDARLASFCATLDGHWLLSTYLP